MEVKHEGGEVWDIVICVGGLSALTLRRELGGVCEVLSIGTADTLPDDVLGELISLPRWYGLFDANAAGAKRAARLAEQSQRVRLLSWPWGGLVDIPAALRAGHDLAAWAIPQLGPTDAHKREAWILHWLKATAGKARMYDGPARRCCLALLGELDL